VIDFENRLKSLKNRRQGTREQILLENNRSVYDSIDLRSHETYENLTESAGVKYAVGAMAQVSIASTLISTKEGERVATTLIDLLKTIGINTTYDIQGSVPLDIHIEGHSDVDMLIINKDTILIETPAKRGGYGKATDKRPMADIIREIRVKSEDKLTSRYHSATVDCSNNKSIALVGGSLQRKVDIVPSCWYDNLNYQISQEKHDRGVQLDHKGEHSLISNQPFLHMKKVNDKDYLYSGNLKRATRLMKNIVADMPDYKKKIATKLSSFDLTSIAYHMNDSLNVSEYKPLELVEKLRLHLIILHSSEVRRGYVDVPDGSRKVFDSDDKIKALEVIKDEVDALAFAIYKDINPFSSVYDSTALISKHIII
jgi:hypothetical protein